MEKKDEFEVTPEMIAAGARVLYGMTTHIASEEFWAEEIYRAMASVAPGACAVPSPDRGAESEDGMKRKLDELGDWVSFAAHVVVVALLFGLALAALVGPAALIVAWVF